MKRTIYYSLVAAGAAALLVGTFALGQNNAPNRKKGIAGSGGSAPPEESPVGYSDTPVIPGQKWRVHDIDRPRPRHVTPGAQYGQPPSDAIVLFDGKDLSKWTEAGKRENAGKVVDPSWTVSNGYFECVPRKGDLMTKEKFGDMQLHVEWASPTLVEAASQNRGNSGILIMSRYELQVLDSWNNKTYADGQAGAIYGWWPPLVNAVRKTGEWQAYDIAFEAPKFDAAKKLVKPASITVFHNGVLLHHRQEIGGPMAHRVVRPYVGHEAEEPLMLQNHNTKVRYRNIWARKLTAYDSSNAEN
ncbi:MAG: DUF1080 domain-containing protein [Bryobacteraceae bacterium]|nr:DUF1080 domain-containing protein [Bryobacteraceae bacterium]